MLLERMRGDLRELAVVTAEISTKVASNGFLLTRIARTARDQSHAVDSLATALEETARGSEAVAEGADQARALARELRERSQASFTAMQRALDHVAELEAGAAESADAIDGVMRASEVIASLVDVIEDISARTNLLGINAAIEAAHAGDAGRGFGVVAAEIKKLADSTRRSAGEIGKSLADVRAVVERATSSARSNAVHAQGVAAEANGVRDDLGGMRTAIERLGERVDVIAATVAEQSMTHHDIAHTVKRLADDVRSGVADAQHAGELQLDALTRRAFAVLVDHELGTCVDEVRALAERAADAVEAAIETELARGAVRTGDLFDTGYVAVTRAQARRFAHLFDVARLGPDGFVPPKFSTRWDTALDEPLRAIVDRTEWERPWIDCLAVVDGNGYLTMHARKYRQAITGDPERDTAGNRVKRLLEGAVGLRAARVGLAGADAVPPRATRAAFRAAGVDLRRPAGRRSALLQSYARDTGAVLSDLAVPVYVRGEHWGAVRFSFDATSAG